MYAGDCRIVSFLGKTEVEEVDSTGKSKIVHMSDVKYVLPTDSVISRLQDCQSFSRQSKLRVDPQHIPNFKWEPTVTVNTRFSAVTSKLAS